MSPPNFRTKIEGGIRQIFLQKYEYQDLICLHDHVLSIEITLGQNPYSHVWNICIKCLAENYYVVKVPQALYLNFCLQQKYSKPEFYFKMNFLLYAQTLETGGNFMILNIVGHSSAILYLEYYLFSYWTSRWTLCSKFVVTTNLHYI